MPAPIRTSDKNKSEEQYFAAYKLYDDKLSVLGIGKSRYDAIKDYADTVDRSHTENWTTALAMTLFDMGDSVVIGVAPIGKSLKVHSHVSCQTTLYSIEGGEYELKDGRIERGAIHIRYLLQSEKGYVVKGYEPAFETGDVVEATHVANIGPAIFNHRSRMVHTLDTIRQHLPEITVEKI